MKSAIDYSLYLVTDRDLMSSATIEESVEQAVRGGCTVVQLREKTASSLDFYEYAVRVKRITDAHGVPLIINDRVDIALAVGAAGIHVGQTDLPAPVVRRLAGPDMILGVSATTFDQAVAAARDGADYLGIGAMFATDTKSGAVITPMEELVRIRAAVALPIVVIGGIKLATIPAFAGTGIDGLSVVSGIISQPDVEKAARDMKKAFAETVANAKNG